VSSRIPSGSRSWRSPPSTLLRVPPMEVERFKHRQLVPTVGPIVTIIRRIRRTNHQKVIHLQRLFAFDRRSTLESPQLRHCENPPRKRYSPTRISPSLIQSTLRAHTKTKYASSPKMESAQLDVFTPSSRSTNSSSESRKIRGNLLFPFGLEVTREPAGRTAPLGVPIST
jgi:hypothetical protein